MLPLPEIRNSEMEIRKLEVRLRVSSVLDIGGLVPVVLTALEDELTTHRKRLVGEKVPFQVKPIRLWENETTCPSFQSLAWVATYSRK